MQDIRLMIIDVDGTLLTPEKELTRRAVEAVHALRRAGVHVALTSGRPPRGLRMLVKPLGLTTPIAAFNGGMMVKPDLTIIKERTLSPDAAKEAVALIKQHGLDAWVYRKAEWYVTRKDAPHVDREQRTVEFEPKVVSSLDDLLDAAAKIVGVTDDSDAIKRCAKAVRELSGVSAALSQPYYLDVTHPDANKGSVVEFLSGALSIPEEQIATIGDMPNDVAMFKRSRVSIAMGNAGDEVKGKARHVVASNTEEGFARAVEDIVLPETRGYGTTSWNSPAV